MITKSDIQFVKSLRDKKSRLDSGLFIAEGDKLISELADSRLTVERIYKTAKSTLINGVEVSDGDLARMSTLKTPQSSLALVRMPGQSVNGDHSLVLVLDGVQDPGNMGTIIRLADWFGVPRIYCSHECADCFAPKVVQATMGAIARVEVVYTDLVEYLKSVEGKVYGTFLERSENIYDADLRSGNAVLVMGSEGRGISSGVEALVSDRLYIPPFPCSVPTVESLNVGVATAIAVAEFRRTQRA